MKAGMLWYINEQGKDIAESITVAVQYFIDKYGQDPLTCYVHSASLDTEIILESKLKVIPNDKVNRNHLWLEFPEG